jgi:hypothetical protein
MPGDRIQPHPIFNATRAVTIQARPEQIWPWLVQIGYLRAGWCGYDWIDNEGLKSADRIIPALQHLKVGDDLPIWRANNYKVVAVEPNHYPVWIEQHGHSRNPSRFAGRADPRGLLDHDARWPTPVQHRLGRLR